MKKSMLLAFLGLVILGIPAKAQQNIPQFKYADTSLSDYIYNHVNFDVQHICDRELHLIRFRIDPSGKVTDISFSRNMDSPIRNALRAVLLSTSGKWKPARIGSKSVMSKFIILPCLIGIENGCSQQVINAYFQPNDSFLKMGSHIDSLHYFVFNSEKRTLSSYYASKSFKAMNDLFYFDEDKMSFPIDYIILNQIDFVYYD